MRTGNNRVWQLTNRSALLRKATPHETLGAVNGVHRIFNRMRARLMTNHRRGARHKSHYGRQERTTSFIHQDARTRVIAVRHQRIGGAKIDANDRISNGRSHSHSGDTRSFARVSWYSRSKCGRVIAFAFPHPASAACTDRNDVLLPWKVLPQLVAHTRLDLG